MDWEEFHDDVLPVIPAYETALVDYYLRRAAIELCDTGIHVVSANSEDIVAGVAEYTLISPESETEIVRPLWVWVAGSRVDPITETELSRLTSRWDEQEAEQPSNYIQTEHGRLRLVPRPTANITAGLTARVAIGPSRDADGVADWVGDNYYREIAAGCKAMLMELPGKPWSAPDYAKMFRLEFEAAKRNARIAVSRSLTNAQQRVQMSRYW